MMTMIQWMLFENSWHAKHCTKNFPYLLSQILGREHKQIMLLISNMLLSPVPFSSVAQSCLTVCDPTNHSTPGLPVSHQLPSSRKPMSIDWGCHPTITSSVVPFYSPQSFPASGSFPKSQLFSWGGQSFWVSASASVLPMNTQDWSPLGWIGWISLQSKGHSRVFSSTTVQKHQFFGAQFSSHSNSHIHTWTLEKNIALTRQNFVGIVMSLLFNMLSRLIVTFLPRNKHLFISWLQSPSAVILETPK